MQLATQWNAVLLIDEVRGVLVWKEEGKLTTGNAQADIYLEKRSSQHLDRNALVGVFLRCKGGERVCHDTS